MALQAGPVDAVVDFAASEPIFVGLLVAMLGVILFLYLLLRRTVLGLREGYDAGRES